jgi:iron complex outermembrane receptor protein
VAVPIPDASGQDLPYSPPFSGFVRGDYRVATSVGDFKGTATVSYNDKSYVQASNLLERPSYYLVSASVEWWSASSSPIGVRVWGRNLTDEYYPIQRTESSDGWQQNCAPPRTYGITLLKDF